MYKNYSIFPLEREKAEKKFTPIRPSEAVFGWPFYAQELQHFSAFA
ncbi:MAG: hypothetical protein ACE5I8_09100 [Thermodesulfobacteriota bacterium]